MSGNDIHTGQRLQEHFLNFFNQAAVSTTTGGGKSKHGQADMTEHEQRTPGCN